MRLPLPVPHLGLSVGDVVVMEPGHLWEGERGRYVGWEWVLALWAFVPVARLENGQRCLLTRAGQCRKVELDG